MAIALAPILILSAIQSRAAFRLEEDRVEHDLLDAATDSAHAAQVHVDASLMALRTLGRESLGTDCSSRLAALVASGDHYEALASIDRSGRVLCASRPLKRSRVDDRPWFAQVRSGRDVSLSASPASQLSDEPAVIAAARRETPAGEFAGAVVAVVPIQSLQEAGLTGSDVPGTEVALVDADGRVLATTDATAFPTQSPPPRSQVGRLSRIRDARGEARVQTVAAFAGEDLFVVATAPSQDLFRWAMANTLAVFILPLLAWFAALVSVMVVTERVIVRWLTYLERVASLQARGRHSVRPTHAQEGPEEIRSLATAMDAMVLAIEARDASLRESLDEKDALMREIHHRVKNNLQVITSLLNMQQRALKDPVARAAMNDTRQRITALALIYRALYQSETLKQVNVATFLNDLVSQLITTDPSAGPPTETLVEAEPLIVDPDKLAPVALWAVEAISNAQKHALTGRGGRLVVRFYSEGDLSTVEVEDDGPGIDTPDEVNGLGHTLMTAFARQLRGEATFDHGPMGGHRARLVFPIPNVSLEQLTDSAGRRNQRLS